MDLVTLALSKKYTDDTVSGAGSFIRTSEKGAANGVAELDSNGLVPTSQLPSYVDDVLDGTAQGVSQTGAGTYSATGFILTGESSPTTPEEGKTYVDTTTNIQYRWTGSVYVSMGSNLTLGETQYSAYRGDRGKTAYDHATDSSRLTTATNSGLYKVASTSEGHIANLTAVTKKDITDLGIPAQDTVYDDTSLSGRVSAVEGLLNNHTVNTDVPSDAVFTDTVYDDTSLSNRVTSLEQQIPIIEQGNVYGMRIDGDESDPSNMITYLADAVGMTPAYMDYTNDVFDYGSWKDVIKDIKPCVLNANGTVYCYLDPDDFTKDIDGNDVTNIVNGTTDNGQNVMIEFSKFWLKIVPYNNGKSAYVYIADYQVNSTYKDYAYIDKNGNHKEHFYMPAFNGSIVNNGTTDVMRSLLGKTVSKSKTAQAEINACVANGDGWYTEDAGEVMLINMLLLLIGKSTDTQTVFGQGLTSGGTETINDGFTTGVHATKGMFYGTNSGAAATYTNAVKLFGIENWYGFQWRRYAGDILDNSVLKVKLCWGTEDGSTVNDFNLDGDGYVTIPDCTPSGTNGGYISEMKCTSLGMFSKVSSGSSSTYYCDGQWYNNSGVKYALRGGDSDFGLRCGALYVYRVDGSGAALWHIGAAISYK